MVETFFVRFHEAIVLIYFLCVICMTLDLFQKNYRLQNMGFYLLGIVWVCQTISLTMYILWRGQLPLTSIVESIYVLTWLILTFTFICAVFRQFDVVIVLLNMLGFVFMVVHTFHPYQFSHQGARLKVINELLTVHISFALISYVIFAIAFVNAILYLIQYQNLRLKRFNQNYFRIGSVSTLEKTVFYFTLIGVITLFVSLLCGVQWGLFSVGPHIFVDLKVISSFFIFLSYVAYIAMRMTQRFKQQFLIYVNIILFLCCMINLIVVTQLSSFHQWTGV
ncbi:MULTISPECIES: cytochrome c biogenesis protein [unclassified Staphylococcus]|uniref:cytochrome c biogenesis protein n=1 Tax=unclassified Staphylococcus TaxID=91994 RepID=UPI0021D32C89|nr:MULTISPECIES: cytochrome c biogenesis protein [unclassified Staphylococcus]UXR77426.1 cytochrome c biogenesis protein [Staphylococcus sp. IVB6227]UXR81689.1 cytochrome c biogenesis protein [Staphylococcus sp. IVB6214]